ncbi:unnamed protein product [Parajaminaea phylloscopi]
MWSGSLPPANTALHVIVDHQGKTSRLLPIPCARSLTCSQLQDRLERKYALPRHDFEIEWVDDDGDIVYIADDESLREAIDFFTPASQMLAHANASTLPAVENGPAESSGSVGNNNGTPHSSSGAVSSGPPSRASIAHKAVEMHIRLRLCSRISLSDFVSSHGGSSSGGSLSGESSWSADEEGQDDRVSISNSRRSSSRSEPWQHIELPSSGRPSKPEDDETSSRLGSRYKIPLNGKSRLASHTRDSDSSSEEGTDEEGTEYAFSAEGSMSHGLRDRPAAVHALGRGGSVHSGVACAVCQSQPIVGARYLCVMCPGGPSFCDRCEDSGMSIQHAPHLSTHALLKLIEPFGNIPGLAPNTRADEDGFTDSHLIEDSSAIASMLIRAAQSLALNTTGRLVPQSALLGLAADHSSLDAHQCHGHDLLCSFCSEHIGQGSRFLCANCPLDLPTPEQLCSNRSNSTGSSSSTSPHVLSPSSSSGQSGALAVQDTMPVIDPTPSLSDNPHVILTPHEGYNLCEACEKHSLSVHDCNHFFIKMPSASRIARAGNGPGVMPLRLNPYLTITHRTEGLLPELYRSDDLGWEEARRRIQGSPPVGSPQTSSLGVWANGRCLLSYAENAARALSRASDPRAAATPSGSGLSTPRRRHPGRDDPAAAAAAASPLPANLEYEAEYVSSLVHPSLICDICFDVISGVWLRCIHCSSSFDVCSGCEERAMEVHDPQHSFACFKRSVDLDLFKSLVDHLDGGADGSVPAVGPVIAASGPGADGTMARTRTSGSVEAAGFGDGRPRSSWDVRDWGAGRAMVPFLLV